MEKELNTIVKQILKSCKVQNVEEVNHALLAKPNLCNKDTLASFVDKLLKLSTCHLANCQAAAVKIDQLKSERIEIQQTVIDLQKRQLQQVQETVEASVKDSVKTEITTWSEIVQKNVKSASSTQSVKSVQKAVRSAVEDNVRSNNFIIYGCKEEDETYVYEGEEYDAAPENVTDTAKQLLNEINIAPRPQILAASRIGTLKVDSANASKPRPIKVTLVSPETVKLVLGKSSKLKEKLSPHWKCVYLAPDRSKEERAAHSKLVTKLKQMISEDSSKYHYIRDGKIISVDKALSTAA